MIDNDAMIGEDHNSRSQIGQIKNAGWEKSRRNLHLANKMTKHPFSFQK